MRILRCDEALKRLAHFIFGRCRGKRCGQKGEASEDEADRRFFHGFSFNSPAKRSSITIFSFGRGQVLGNSLIIACETADPFR